MTKTQLIEQLVQTTGQSKADSERQLDAVLSTVTKALSEGERLDLRGFGVFQVRETKARQGRNPKTGEALTIAAKKVAVFKPSKELASRVGGSTAASTSK